MNKLVILICLFLFSCASNKDKQENKIQDASVTTMISQCENHLIRTHLQLKDCRETLDIILKEIDNEETYNQVERELEERKEEKEW